MKLNINVSFIVVIILFSIISPLTFAQEWLARYNGPGNGDDKAYALAIDDVGNVYVTGWSWRSGAGYEYATLKYDVLGVEQWVARYGGPQARDNTWDFAYALAVDNTGNVYVTGCSEGIGTGKDFATIKYDTSGNEQWVARYNGPDNGSDCANAITVDNTDNIYVTGESGSAVVGYDYATVKYDASGNEQWAARYNGSANNWDRAYAIAVDDMHNVYVTGWSEGINSGYDYATVKYDASGNEQWAARYSGAGSSDDCAYAIAVDDMHNVYVTGWSEGINSGYDYATVKYDASGNEQWAARYNGSANNWDRAYAIAVDDMHNVYVTGWSEGINTGYDYATIKYDSAGIGYCWLALYNGPSNGFDYAYALAVDNSGNVYVTGWSEGINTDYDYATVMYDSSGAEKWVARYDGPNNDQEMAHALVIDDAGNIYVTGWSEGLGTSDDYATIKYSSVGLEEDTEFKIHDTKYSLMIRPNPFRQNTDIRFTLLNASDCELKIYDATGRLVKTFSVPSSYSLVPSVISWNGLDDTNRKLPSGVYFLKFEARHYSFTKKLLLIR